MLLAISETEAYDVGVLKETIHAALENTKGNVYILVVTETKPLTISSLTDQLEHIYSVSVELNSKLDNERSITMILEDENYDSTVAKRLWQSLIYSPKLQLDQIPLAYRNHIDSSNISQSVITSSQVPKPKHEKYKLCNPKAEAGSVSVAAVGGTFDHLHDGHKILLTVSAFLTLKTLIVGVTGAELLRNKKFAEYMQSYEKRVENVTSFVETVKPSLKPSIYEINDVCGPTVQIEDIDALIVSLESSKGGDFVNNKRKEIGWKELDIYTIGVVGSNDQESFTNKLSSTDYRKSKFLQDKQKQ